MTNREMDRKFCRIIQANYTRAEMMRLHELASWLKVRAIKAIDQGGTDNG